MLILGVHNGHDAGAAIIDDGHVIYSISEERLNRKKSFWGPPVLSIQEVLNSAGVQAADINHVAQSGITAGGGAMPEFRQVGPLKKLADYSSLLPFMRTRLVKNLYLMAFSWQRADKVVDETLRAIGCTAKKRFLEHHYCHAASAYYCSPFGERPQDALVITADASGDGLSSTISVIDDNHQIIRKHETTVFKSLAAIYGYVTFNLGFKPMRHEGKITGLAAYGDAEKTAPVFRSIMHFDHDAMEMVSTIGWGRPCAAKLNRMLQSYNREDIAAGMQLVFQEVVSSYVDAACRRYDRHLLCLAGGLFANVRLNQVLRELDSVEDLYIHPAMGDAGMPVGAAMGLRANLVDNPKPIYLSNVYLGSRFDDAAIEKALKKQGLSYRRSDDIAADTAKELARERVVARFHGAMEYGPRALGHRSIFYHTQDPTINDWLNKRLNRTEFMPFAPIILKERAAEFLESYDPERSCADNFMTVTYNVTAKCLETSPAVCHVDGTARPQLVTEKNNQDTYAILKAYETATGSPILINTSFNMHEEPIVCSPDDAIKGFLDGNLDVLSIGSFLVEHPDLAVIESNKSLT